MKKLFFYTTFIATTSLLFLSSCDLTNKPVPTQSSSSINIENYQPSCSFCNIIAKKSPAKIIDENDKVIAFMSTGTHPHPLIVPKKHIQNIQSLQHDDLHFIPAMIKMAQKIHQKTGTDFSVQINNGVKAGQTVFHLHMHFYPAEP